MGECDGVDEMLLADDAHGGRPLAADTGPLLAPNDMHPLSSADRAPMPDPVLSETERRVLERIWSLGLKGGHLADLVRRSISAVPSLALPGECPKLPEGWEVRNSNHLVLLEETAGERGVVIVSRSGLVSAISASPEAVHYALWRAAHG